VSRHRIPLGPKPRRKYLSTPYGKKLTFIEGWNFCMAARVPRLES
jgi:hypothetical protein